MNLNLGLGLSGNKGAGGGAFSPLDLFAASEDGGLWDFTDTSLLYTDTGQTTNVTSDGDSVRSAQDLTTNNNDASQVLSAGQSPTWRPAETAIEWDGGDSLDVGAIPRDAGQTLAVRFKHSGTTPGNLIGAGDGTGNSYIDFDDGVPQLVVDNIVNPAILRTDDDAWHTFVATWVDTDLEIYLDGEKVFDGTKQADHSNEPYNIGSRGQFGAFVGAYTGEISHALIRDQDVTLTGDQARGIHNAWMGESVAAPDQGAHRYWRLVMHQGASAFIHFSEIELRASASGADETSPSTTIVANSTFGGLPATNLVDNSNGTEWATNSPPGANPITLEVDFGVGVTKEIVEVSLRNTANASREPESFLVQYSDDNSNWTTSWVDSDPTWAGTETIYVSTRP